MDKRAMDFESMSGCAAKKKAKLSQLLQFKSKLPDHSQAALAAILKEVKKSGAPELHSSNHQKKARKALLQECHGGALGNLIQEAKLYREDGTSTTMFYANLVYLAAVYHQGGSMFQLIQRQHQANPSKWKGHGVPLSIVMRLFQDMSWEELSARCGASV